MVCRLWAGTEESHNVQKEWCLFVRRVAFADCNAARPIGLGLLPGIGRGLAVIFRPMDGPTSMD